MTDRADVEDYLEGRVREIDEFLSSWFGVEEYDDSLPNIDIDSKYRGAKYDEWNDIIGVSPEYVAERIGWELDAGLAEELAHRIHKIINPTGSNDISEFFGRLGEHLYSNKYGQDVDEVSLDRVKRILEDKTELEEEARERDQKNQPDKDELPSTQEFRNRSEEVLKQIKNQNYEDAKNLLGKLKDAARKVDEMILVPELEDVEETVQELERGETEYEVEERFIEMTIEDAIGFYDDQKENVSSLDGVNESLASIGSENVRQHLTYAFADRHFEKIEAMNPEERAELLKSPETIWDFLIEEDEELQKFYHENKLLLENNLDLVKKD